MTRVPADVEVRAERPGDEDFVRAVIEAAFGKSDEARIVDEIRGTDRSIADGSLVAEVDDRIVGHLLLSEGDLISDEGGLRRIWMVGPVAVLPQYQRRGIGGMLMRASIELAKQCGQPVLCLLGHAEYYPRFGFESARGIGIEPPMPWSDINWMALRLPDWDPSVRGVARFAPAFGD